MELTKAQKRALRAWAETAYERALRAELQKLAADFARWRQGEIDSFELSDLIHRFHNGPSRELWSYYTSRLEPQWKLGRAVHEGLIAPEELPSEVQEILQPILERLASEPSQDRPAADAQP